MDVARMILTVEKLEDRIFHVSEDANPMAHFHDSSASTTGDTSSSVSKDVETKQIKGIGVVEVQAPDVQLELLDWMSNSKDNQKGMDMEHKMVSDNFSFQQAIRPKFGLQHSSNVVSGVTSETEFEPLHNFSPDSSASFADKHLIMEEDDSLASSRVDDLEQNSLPSSLGGAEDKNDAEVKRWKAENVSDQTSSAYGGRIVEEPKVVMHTISEGNILDDGYSWRKYGKKDLRSYYICAFLGCPVKKRVDPASHDSRVVTTTYEGTHNHGSSSNNMYMHVLDLPFQNIEQPTTQTQSPYIKGSDGFPGL